MDCAASAVAMSARLGPGCPVVTPGLTFRLGVRQGVVQGLSFGNQFPYFARIDAVHQSAFLRHLPSEVLSGDQSVKIADRQRRRKELFDFLSHEVVEVTDLVGRQYFQMHRQVADPLLVLERQPRRERHLLAYLSDELLIHLGAPFEAVQSVLQFADELICLWSQTSGVAGSFQVGNRTDLISFCLIRHYCEIPPGTLFFDAFRFSLSGPLLMSEAAADKARETIALD